MDQPRSKIKSTSRLRLPSAHRSTLLPLETDDPPVSSRDQQAPRRLGSLSSLSNLNPFGRRTSLGVASTHAAKTNDSAPETGTKLKTDRKSSRRGSGPDLTKEKAARRGSWIPVPERHAGSIPRSRTTGSLLPTITTPAREKTTGSDPIEKEHTSTQDAPRQSSLRSRLPSASKNALRPAKPSIALPRSGTEPSLAPPLEDRTLMKQPAKKENIPRVLPRSFTQRKLNAKEARTPAVDKDRPPPPAQARTAFTSHSPSSGQPHLRQATATRIGTYNTPPSRARLIDIPRRGLPRSHTQPELRKGPSELELQEQAKSGAEIEYHALLSPKQPPTPVQKSPLSALAKRRQSGGRPVGIYQKSLVPKFSQSPQLSVTPTSPDASLPRTDSYDPATVVVAEPIEYWSGRFMSLLDRWRTEQFHNRIARDSTQPQDDTHAKREEYRHILSELYADCEGEDAKGSLQTFHAFLRTMGVTTAVGEEEGVAARMVWRDVVGDGEALKRVRTGVSSEATESVELHEQSGLAAIRKGTLIDRLLGRKARTELRAVKGTGGHERNRSAAVVRNIPRRGSPC